MPDSADPAALSGRRPGFALAWGIAVLPGVVLLQALPRMLDPEQQAAAGPLLAWAGTLLPLGGAAVAGLAAAVLAGSGLRGAMAAGGAAQLPAIPGFLGILGALAEAGFYLDAAVYFGLFASYVTLCAAAGGYAARWWGATQDPAAGESTPASFDARRTLALMVPALVFLAVALITLSNPLAPLFYAVSLGLAASVTSFTAWRYGNGPAQGAAAPVMMAGMAVAAFAVSLMAGETVNPPPADLEGS